MKTVVQVKSFRSNRFLFCIYFFVPYSSQMYLCGFQFYSNKGWLMKVTHFWLMDMSVNWRRQTLQIELFFSIVHTLFWFLMYQSHKMSLFKGEEKTFNKKIAGKLHWHIYMDAKIHYKQKQTTCNIESFRDRMSCAHLLVIYYCSFQPHQNWAASNSGNETEHKTTFFT